MKKIKLSQGKYALVDDEDYVLLSRFNWFAHKTRGERWGAETILQDKNIHMHRFIMGAPPMRGAKKYEVDHINRNALDNRKSNLRWVTRSKNLSNRRKFGGANLSKYVGVRKTTNKTNPWAAMCIKDGKQIHIGVFKTEVAAHIARLRFIKKLNKENK